jgi:hypothetical protein
LGELPDWRKEAGDAALGSKETAFKLAKSHQL